MGHKAGSVSAIPDTFDTDTDKQDRVEKQSELMGDEPSEGHRSSREAQTKSDVKSSLPSFPLTDPAIPFGLQDQSPDALASLLERVRKLPVSTSKRKVDEQIITARDKYERNEVDRAIHKKESRQI